MSRKRHRLAQRRKTVGLSQEQLAEAMRVDRSTIVRWERAETEPQPWHRPRLAALLRLTIDELADILADVGGSAQPGRQPSAPLAGSGTVDLIAVAQLRERIRQLDERYERTPSPALLAEAGQLHGQAVLLRQQSARESVRVAMWAAVAASATLMARLVWDASQRRNQNIVVAYLNEAVRAANQARDSVAAAYAELRKSYVELYTANNPVTGLALAERAAAGSQQHSEAVAALAKLHAAEAHAMLGDQRACEAALEAADRHGAEVRPDELASAIFCPSQRGRLIGSCWLRLDQPDKAERVLQQTRTLLGGRKKSAAIVLGNLALAYVRQRDIHAAATHLHEAIDVLEQTQGGGGFTVVFTAARELGPWQREQPLRDVHDRLYTLMAGASTNGGNR